MSLPEFNINSKDHLSALLFSGTIKIDVVEPVLNPDGTLKITKTTGKIKCHKVKKDVKIKGLNCIPKNTWKTKKDGVYQTNKSVLLQIAEEFDDEE